MCLYPKLIRNPKYKPNRKNNFTPPVCMDRRVLYVPIGCGNCIECRKQKSREWQVRLNEELKERKLAYFITLTFSNEELLKLKKETNLKESNALAQIATRRFLERWRKKYKKSVRHWLITELGHENTERIHMHGILFPDFVISNEILENIWSYGQTYIGDYCNAKTINYVIKYITKIDTDHKGFKAQIFTSAGIGNAYTKKYSSKEIHKFNDKETIEYYRLPNGAKVNMPIYYRNKFFTEEQREQLWRNLLDKNERYILGMKVENVDTDTGEKLYYDILKKAQETNKEMGYGDDSKEWSKKEYNVTWNMLKKRKKVARANLKH